MNTWLGRYVSRSLSGRNTSTSDKGFQPTAPYKRQAYDVIYVEYIKGQWQC